MPLTSYFLLLYPVALCKPTGQSTTIDPVGNDFTPGFSSYAVDGTPALSHTTCEQAPWWEVDLLTPRAIDNVVIKNRQDCCFERLNGLLVELLDKAGQVVESFQRKSVKTWVGFCSKLLSRSKPFYRCCIVDILDDPANGPINPILVVPFDAVVAQRVKVSIDVGQGDCIFLNLQGVEVFSQCLESQDSCYATPSDTHRPCYANRPLTFNV